MVSCHELLEYGCQTETASRIEIVQRFGDKRVKSLRPVECGLVPRANPTMSHCSESDLAYNRSPQQTFRVPSAIHLSPLSQSGTCGATTPATRSGLCLASAAATKPTTHGNTSTCGAPSSRSTNSLIARKAFGKSKEKSVVGMDPLNPGTSNTVARMPGSRRFRSSSYSSSGTGGSAANTTLLPSVPDTR